MPLGRINIVQIALHYIDPAAICQFMANLGAKSMADN